MIRTASRVLVVALVAVAAAGCVSKKTYQACQDQVAACEAEKAALQEQVKSWESRFDSESKRWETMHATVTDALPQAVKQLESERERIIKLVPAEVQRQVEDYLDRYFDTVMKGFSRLQEDNATIRRELEATNTRLASVGSDTSEIRTVSTSIDAKLEEERAKRALLAAKVAEIAQKLAYFDQTRINCKDCPNKLGLNRTERETITAFHQEMMTALTSLQAEAN